MKCSAAPRQLPPSSSTPYIHEIACREEVVHAWDQSRRAFRRYINGTFSNQGRSLVPVALRNAISNKVENIASGEKPSRAAGGGNPYLYRETRDQTNRQI